MKKSLLFLGAILLASPMAQAETTFSFYTGDQSAPHSRVWGDDVAPFGAGPFDFTAGWEGRPFVAPIHWGIRIMHWTPSNWGFGFDGNHNKVYADAETFTKSGFEVLEFSDGLNTTTFNVTKRWVQPGRKTVYYAGGGVGYVMPHVEVKTTDSSPHTFEYQIAGPSAMLNAGAEFPINNTVSLFAEYKITYNVVRAKLDGGDGSGYLNTNVITNAINLGVTYHLRK